MARIATILDDDILGVAKLLFLEKGLQATTAEVAERASISEGTIFKRFGSKENLFQRAMLLEASPEGLVAKVSAGCADLSIEKCLEKLAQVLVEKFRRIVPLISLYMGGALNINNHPFFAKGKLPPAICILTDLEQFFEHMKGEHKLRRNLDCAALARVFMGSLWQYVFLEYMMHTFAGRKAHSLSTDKFVREHVHILLYGVARPQKKKSKMSPKLSLPKDKKAKIGRS